MNVGSKNLTLLKKKIKKNVQVISNLEVELTVGYWIERLSLFHLNLEAHEVVSTIQNFI